MFYVCVFVWTFCVGLFQKSWTIESFKKATYTLNLYIYIFIKRIYMYNAILVVMLKRVTEFKYVSSTNLQNIIFR